jgi:aminoglycoside/choline kinase family phosphotransferase
MQIYGDSTPSQNSRYFVRLFERDGKSGYLKDLPRVMWYLLEESKVMMN